MYLQKKTIVITQSIEYLFTVISIAFKMIYITTELPTQDITVYQQIIHKYSTT